MDNSIALMPKGIIKDKDQISYLNQKKQMNNNLIIKSLNNKKINSQIHLFLLSKVKTNNLIKEKDQIKTEEIN